jgi:hypothetical protein
LAFDIQVTETPFGALEFGQGKLKLWVSEPGRGHPPEFWADRAMERIMSVADSAPQPIRDQAYAFKEQVARVVLEAIKNAVAERKIYDAMNAGKISEAASQAVKEGA